MFEQVLLLLLLLASCCYMCVCVCVWSVNRPHFVDKDRKIARLACRPMGVCVCVCALVFIFRFQSTPYQYQANRSVIRMTEAKRRKISFFFRIERLSHLHERWTRDEEKRSFYATPLCNVLVHCDCVYTGSVYTPILMQWGNCTWQCLIKYEMSTSAISHQWHRIATENEQRRCNQNSISRASTPVRCGRLWFGALPIPTFSSLLSPSSIGSRHKCAQRVCLYV